MNLRIGKVRNYNNKILISSPSFNIGTNLKINLDGEQAKLKDKPDVKPKGEGIVKTKPDVKQKEEPDVKSNKEHKQDVKHNIKSNKELKHSVKKPDTNKVTYKKKEKKKNSQFLKPQNLLQLLLISIYFSREIEATI